MIAVKIKGDWTSTEKWLRGLKHLNLSAVLHKYGQAGVAALTEATPIRTGKTASSWSYEIENHNGTGTIYWRNSNVNNGVPIAILIQYGHVNRNGAWIKGRDYINPALRPILDELADKITEEVK